MNQREFIEIPRDDCCDIGIWENFPAMNNFHFRGVNHIAAFMTGDSLSEPSVITGKSSWHN
jgi:hypothetical protein